MRLNTLIGTVFAGLAFLFLLLTMFLPMHANSGGGFSVESTVWGVDFEAGSESEHNSWFDDEFNDEDGTPADGIHALRASGIIMVFAVVAAFAATGLGALSLIGGNYRNIAMYAAIGACAIAMVALITYSVGFNELTDGEDTGLDSAAAFGLSIAAILLAAFSAAVLFLRTDLQQLLVAPMEAE